MRTRGLILKDMYTLSGQLKVFGVMILLFACIPMGTMQGTAIIISAILPMTALGYDDQSKWGKLAATMPYSKRDLIRSKYILGIIFIVCASVLVSVTGLIAAIFTSKSIIELFAIVGVGVGAGIVLLSVSLPLMFKFGSEKGRIAMMIVTFIVTMVSVTSSSLIKYVQININPIVGIPVLIGIILVVLNISMMISERVYKSDR